MLCQDAKMRDQVKKKSRVERKSAAQNNERKRKREEKEAKKKKVLQSTFTIVLFNKNQRSQYHFIIQCFNCRVRYNKSTRICTKE